MYVIVDPDVNVAIDPASGIAAEMDPSLPIANIAELSEGIEEIERAAIDLVDSLNPATVPYPSYPNREGIYLNLGKVSNAVIGFILGLAAVAILLIVILAGGL
jgi:tetrahydromethanopterin S-methyltransferase subunit B